MKDRVIFRKWNRKTLDDGIIAFLPDVPANPGMVMAYEHIGQHGEADYYHCLGLTHLAKPHEYADLLAELTGIGYEMVVCGGLQYKWKG